MTEIAPHTLTLTYTQSQSHGKIVRRLSKKLKVGSRKVVPPNEFAAVRPHSPVLYHAKPTPLYLHSLLEQSDSGSSQNTTTNSVGMYMYIVLCVYLIVVVSRNNYRLSVKIRTHSATNANEH